MAISFSGGSALNPSSWGDKLASGEKKVRKTFGFDESEQRQKESEMRAQAQEEYGQQEILRGQMGRTGQKYIQDVRRQYEGYKPQAAQIQKDLDLYNQQRQNDIFAVESEFQNNLDTLKRQTEQQATDARQTYTNDIQPKQKELMERSMQNASQAMSLQDAMSMDNQVTQAYERLAGGERQRGLADFGVLSALGAQAMAGQMRGPMTVGQQQAMQAVGQQQASQAFSRTQRRMDELRQQGLEASRGWYETGQRAQDRAAGRIGEYEAGGRRARDEQTGYRGEIGAYDQARRGSRDYASAEKYGLQRESAGRRGQTLAEQQAAEQGLLGMQYDLDMQNRLQEQQNISQRYGQQRAIDVGTLQRLGGQAAGGRQMLGSLIGAGATLGAGAMGGSAGSGGMGQAVAGGFAQGIGQGMASNQGAYSAGPSYQQPPGYNQPQPRSMGYQPRYGGVQGRMGYQYA